MTRAGRRRYTSTVERGEKRDEVETVQARNTVSGREHSDASGICSSYDEEGEKERDNGHRDEALWEEDRSKVVNEGVDVQ